MSISVDVTVDIDLDDVFEEISDEDLIEECNRRNITLHGRDSALPVDLESIAFEISTGNHPRAIDLTKQYIWESCGRIVN